MTIFSFKGISARRKAQLRLIGGIHTQIANALAEEWRRRRLTRRKIAEMLGWDKAALSRKLKASANIKIGTLADLSYALGREPLIFLVPSDRAQEIRISVAVLLSKPGDMSLTVELGTRHHPRYSRRSEYAGGTKATSRHKEEPRNLGTSVTQWDIRKVA